MSTFQKPPTQFVFLEFKLIECVENLHSIQKEHTVKAELGN